MSSLNVQRERFLFWQPGWKVETKLNDVIMAFHQFIVLLGHAVTGMKHPQLCPSLQRGTLSNAHFKQADHRPKWWVGKQQLVF